jgi:polar amino acid transport system substrate-binding protein
LTTLAVFAGCNQTNNGGAETTGQATESEPAKGEASDTESATDAEESSSAADEGDNTSKPVIKMATNAYFKPYEYYDGETIVGIDAEIAAAIAEKLGMTLVIEDMEFDSILTAVQNGSVDFGMAGMTVTDERKESVDFSVSYANGKQVIIVKEGSPITSVDDLYADGANYKVGVQLGTTGDIYSTDDFGAENVTTYNNGNNAVLALLSENAEIDCVIIDNEPAKALVAANSGLKILETSYTDEDYAICVKKGNTELLEKINTAIMELTEDGTIDAILDKYIQ